MNSEFPVRGKTSPDNDAKIFSVPRLFVISILVCGSFFDWFFLGYWMLGPGRYCYRTFKGITSIKQQLTTVFLLFAPKTASELEAALNLLAKFKTGIKQFKENLKSGIRTGMVGSVTVCKEGKECLEDIYIEVSSQQSGRGILTAFQDQISTFVSELSSHEAAKIMAKHGMNGADVVEESLVRNVGSPLLDIFEYLQNEHLSHCLPTNVSSGLGTLPVNHVYLNGSKTLEMTNPTFREGDTVLPGKESYKNFLSYYTTQEITPGNWSKSKKRTHAPGEKEGFFTGGREGGGYFTPASYLNSEHTRMYQSWWYCTYSIIDKEQSH